MAVRHISQKVAVSVVFVAAMFMAIMDTTIVNVALPTIGRDFHVPPDRGRQRRRSPSSSAWRCSFRPRGGWATGSAGRRVLLPPIVVFTAASALCGLASQPGRAGVFRILQGVGGGMLAPVGMAMLFRVFPPAERVRASSILTDPHGLRPGPRPGPRRPARHRPVVALGLLRQRPDRGGGRHLRAALPRRPTTAGQARPLRPGRVPPRRRRSRACSCTACPRDPLKGWDSAVGPGHHRCRAGAAGGGGAGRAAHAGSR